MVRISDKMNLYVNRLYVNSAEPIDVVRGTLIGVDVRNVEAKASLSLGGLIKPLALSADPCSASSHNLPVASNNSNKTSIKHIQHSDDLLCSPLLSIDDLSKSRHVWCDGRAMNPPEDYEVDDDAADIPERKYQQRQLAYPTSGTRQTNVEEDQTK